MNYHWYLPCVYYSWPYDNSAWNRASESVFSECADRYNDSAKIFTMELFPVILFPGYIST